MRRIIAIALSTLGLMSIMGTAQAAYPTSPYSLSYSGIGSMSGGVIWYNRSVGIQGSVRDYAGGSPYTTARFITYAGAYSGPSGTRTAANGATISYNFTLDGSAYPGGITQVAPFLCSNTVCQSPGSALMNRP